MMDFKEFIKLLLEAAPGGTAAKLEDQAKSVDGLCCQVCLDNSGRISAEQTAISVSFQVKF